MKLTKMRQAWRPVVVASATVFAVPAVVALAPPAAAAECPDVDVVFARGTDEPPGLGGVGQSFVDSIRQQAGARSVGEYAVNYPANNDFNASIAAGVGDARGHIESMAATCPGTRIVLGGYSQGALVAGFTTSDTAPAGVPAGLVPAPLPAAAADHVAAVVLFGTPSEQFLAQYDAPQLVIGPSFADKTLRLCAQGDTICDGGFTGAPTVAHALYGVNGQVNEGAAFAVGRL